MKKILFYSSTILRMLVYIVALQVLFVVNSRGEDTVTLKPLVITSTRIEGDAGGESKLPIRESDSTRLAQDDSVEYLSVPSLLNENTLVDTRTRGPFGMQTDISLRGAPFEENLVMLNGISINDPKSGHHNMDLPITIFDVERADITYGSASAVYGSGAMGGAINIIPRSPTDDLEFFVSSLAGPWDLYSGGVSLNVPIGVLKNRTSVEWKRSTGFAPETEFNALTASSYSVMEYDKGKMDVFLGYLTKKFGASTFYSNLYPNEEESINTGIIIARGEFKEENFYIKPSIYWKRLQDKFILDRNRPSFSRNDHTTNIYGGEIAVGVSTPIGEMVLGTSVGSEDVSSTNLGNHKRLKVGGFLEYEEKIYNFLVNGSVRMDYYSTFGFEFSPSVSAAYEIISGLSVRAGASRAFRAPSFTELYYSTVANRGNPDLKPENSWTYETGINYRNDILEISSDIFLRNSEKVIDWTRATPQSVWTAENIGEVDLYGVETSWRLDTEKLTGIENLKALTVKYSYLECLDKKGITSKYVLAFLKHDLVLDLESKLPFDIKNKIIFTFRKRIGSEKYFLLDTIFSKDIELETGNMNVFLRLDNIFNTEYTEEGDVKMPGFAAYLGGSVTF